MCRTIDASVSTFLLKSIELFSNSFWLLTRGPGSLMEQLHMIRLTGGAEPERMGFVT